MGKTNQEQTDKREIVPAVTDIKGIGNGMLYMQWEIIIS